MNIKYTNNERKLFNLDDPFNKITVESNITWCSGCQEFHSKDKKELDVSEKVLHLLITNNSLNNLDILKIRLDAPSYSTVISRLIKIGLFLTRNRDAQHRVAELRPS